MDSVLYEVEAEVTEKGDDQILQLSIIDCKYPPICGISTKNILLCTWYYLWIIVNLLLRCEGNLWCVFRELWEDTFQIRSSALLLLQIVTNLKSTNTNRANAPEVLCSLVFRPLSFNYILRAMFIGLWRKLLTRFRMIDFYLNTVLNSGDVTAFVLKVLSNSLALK